MKLGFNMLLWTTHVTEAHAPILTALKADGYDGVEIPLFEGDPDHFARLGAVIRAAGLEATAVTVMPPGKSCAAADPAERAAALGHLDWAVDCTAALGARLLCGPFHQPLGVFSGSGPTATELSTLARTHRSAARLAAGAGIALAVEPLNRFECYILTSADASARLVAEVGEANYRYLYDTFHFHIEENSQPAAIVRTAAAIGHVHISENTRGTPGTGQVDFKAVIGALKAAGYDGWLTVEAFGSALPDLAAATKIWRPLFAAPEDVCRGAIATMRAAMG